MQPAESIVWSKFWLEFSSQALAAGFGALAGAWLAFGHERRRARDDQRDKNLVSANLALFALNRMWKLTETYEKQILRGWFAKDREGISSETPLWFNVGLTAPPEPVMRFDVERLAFLLDATDGRLIGRVSSVVQEYSRILENLGTRVELLRDARSRWANFKNQYPAMGYSDASLWQQVGTDLALHLRTITATIVRQVYPFLLGVPLLQTEIVAAFQRHFDPARIILYDYLSIDKELGEPATQWMDRYAGAIESR